MTETERRVLTLVATLVLEVRDDVRQVQQRDELRQALKALDHEGASMRRALDVLNRG